MRGDFRRRSTATWAVWGSAFVAVALLMAWKFQWFGNGDPTVVEQGSGSEGDDIAANGDDRAEEPALDVFHRQSEPVAGTGTDVSIPSRFGGSEMPKRFGNEPWNAPTDEPPGGSGRSIGSNPPSASNRDQVEYAAAPFGDSRYARRGTVARAGFETSPRGDLNRVEPNRLNPDRGSSNRIQRTGFDSPKSGSAYGRGTVPADLRASDNAADPGPPAILIARIDQLIQRGTNRADGVATVVKGIRELSKDQRDAILSAHKELSKMYWQRPEWRRAIRTRIEQTAKVIYFSPDTHFMPAYVVRQDDYLKTIAAKYNVPYQYLERLNGVKGRQIREGQELKVIKGPFAVVVDLSDRELTLHHKGWFVARFVVGIGRDRRSPRGTFRVEDKMEKAPYTNFDAVRQEDRRIPGGDRRNPLGSHWIRFDDSFGIHGTNDPNSIGKAESKGCIRMHNSEVAWVYDMLTKSSEIVIQD